MTHKTKWVSHKIPNKINKDIHSKPHYIKTYKTSKNQEMEGSRREKILQCKQKISDSKSSVNTQIAKTRLNKTSKTVCLLLICVTCVVICVQNAIYTHPINYSLCTNHGSHVLNPQNLIFFVESFRDF